MEPNLSHSETLIEDGHTYGKEDARADLDRLHAIYRDTLAAFTASAIVNRVMLTQNEIEVAMEGVGEALSGEADRALEILPHDSYTPSDCKELIGKAHAYLVDAMRVKPIDYTGVFEAIFRPQPNRGSAPTNPATLAAKGDGV